MVDLKPLSKEGVQNALEKAHRYRLLNEPSDAESICRDVLAVEADNEEASVSLLLSLSDQFEDRSDAVIKAREVLPRLKSAYERAYYAGIIEERRGKAQLKRHAPGCGPVVYDSLQRAMAFYEKAESMRPAGNDDAILRWNACARIIERHDSISPEVEEYVEPPLE